MHEQSSGADAGAAGGSGVAPQAPGEEPLSTVRLSAQHRVADFRCARSERIALFLVNEAPRLTAINYCWVYVLPNPADPTEILGYYTLSNAEMRKGNLRRADEKQVPGGIAVPLMRIGYMGRADGTEPGLGAALVLDAGRRVYREHPAWGLILESEGGRSKPTLMARYEAIGFYPAREPEGTMYAPLHRFVPELRGQKYRPG